MIEFVLGNLVVTAGLMTGLWLVSLIIRDASIVDIFWGMAFVAIVWTQYVRAWVLQGPACLPEQCEGGAYPPPTALHRPDPGHDLGDAPVPVPRLAEPGQG